MSAIGDSRSKNRGFVTTSVFYLSGVAGYSASRGSPVIAITSYFAVGLKGESKMASYPVISPVKIVSEGELLLAAKFTASLDRIEGYMYWPDPSILMFKNRLHNELQCLRQLVYEMSIKG